MKRKLTFLTCASMLIVPPFIASANEASTTTQVQKENTEKQTIEKNNNTETQTTQKEEKPSINVSEDIETEETKKVDSLKEELKKVEEKKTNIKEQISEVHKYIDETEKTIMGIENQLATTESQIKTTEESIKKLLHNIEVTQKEIDKKIVELKLQRDKLGQSISFLYENRDFGFFQFFFQTENLSDLLTTVDLINIIADENQKIYNSIQKQEKELKEQKKQLEANKLTVENEKNKLNALKNQQVEQKTKQDAVLVTHKERETQMVNQLTEEEKAQAELMKQINEALKPNIPNVGSENIPLNPNQTLTSPMKAGTYQISSMYGYRTHPVLGYQRLHSGTDFAAPLSTPIYSAGVGTVLFSGPASGFGNWIVIQHDNGLYSIYGHMEANSLYVKPGQRVNQGQHISAVGNQGITSGPHLHFSVATKYDGSVFTYTDPLSVLK
ncbi:peptidoglycan DD-metalloendopeptidase family protein [Bacillus sp. Brlt_9]|uniref:peptidoglycan DD-metalloendopeptidase family protein n=1 Tax=Bacillus sp. Brlt_9 TaxID=3110916 RepID=UPI003F7C8853